MPSKQDRRRQKRLRQEHASTRRSEKEARRAAEEAVQEARRAIAALVESAGKENGDAGAVVDGLGGLADSGAGRRMLAAPEIAAEIGEQLGERAGSRRGPTLAEALSADDRLAWVRVGVLTASGDRGGADRLAVELLDTEEDAARREEGVSVLLSMRIHAGRLADALELLEAECALNPEDEDLQAARARLLSRAANLGGRRGEEARDAEEGFGWPTPAAEQLAAAQTALDRFAGRAGLAELNRAVSKFVAADERLVAGVEARVEEVLSDARQAAGVGPFDTVGEGVRLRLAGTAGDVEEPLAGVRALATEWAWLRDPVGGGDDPREEGRDEPSVLERFAADRGTPPGQAEVARAWQRHVRYGLWQVQLDSSEGRLTGIGTWATDLVTRRTAHLAIPPEQLDGLPRWSVLAGPVGPVNGVWHTGTAMIALDPRLADRVADALLEVATDVLSTLAGEAGLRRPPKRRDPDPERPVPHGVLAELADAMESAEADFTAKVVGANLANIVGFVQHSSRQPPAVANTDGDPVELLEAVFPAGDPSRLRRRLLNDLDFEGGDDDVPAGEVAPPLRWLGRLMTPEEAAHSLAQAQAELRRQGLGPVATTDGPRRWLRGLVRFEPGAVRVEVNSRRRLSALSAKLRAAGAGEPDVRLAFDPAMDLAVPGVAGGGRAPGDREAEAVWRGRWLDEGIPALGGATPRSAAKDPRRRVALESLLRQFEHDADVAAAAGDLPLDVERLRVELEMADGV